MTTTFTQTLAIAAFTVSAFVGLASAASAADNYQRVSNAGIPGFNQETHTNVSAQTCLQLCSGRGWCKSADYERAKGKCFLQPVSQHQQSLRTDYPGNPYDHYHRVQTLVEHGVLEERRTTAPKPAPVANNGRCGKRLSVTGIGAKGLVYKLKKNRAERRAKRAWRAFVAGESSPSSIAGLLGGNWVDTSHASFGMGTRYADLANAKNVVMNCKGGGTMHCTVTATPCAG